MYLFRQWWLPEGKPKAVIIIVHGYGEHSGRYSSVVEYFNTHNYACYTFDLRGHGRSEGPRTLIKSFDEYIMDVEDILSDVQKSKPGLPIFLLGHSLGGAISTLFTITRKPVINGLILSGAYLMLDENVSLLKVRLAFIISTIFPSLPVEKRLNNHLLSRDPEVVKQYEKDPLIYHGSMKAREGVEIIRAIKSIQSQM